MHKRYVERAFYLVCEITVQRSILLDACERWAFWELLWLDGGPAGWPAGWLAGWLAGRLAGWPAGRLVGWLACRPPSAHPWRIFNKHMAMSQSLCLGNVLRGYLAK